jgi:hypothetical protein
MKLKYIGLITITLVALVMNSCYYDNEEELYPVAPACDTSNVTYSGTIVPILQDNGCITCHSGQVPSGNISLEDYDDVASSAAIDPGNYGSLYGSIDHAPGNSPMPKGGGKISDCSIAQVKAWIDDGYPNN